MSYILNALRKSEQERKSSRAVTLENSILEVQDSTPKKTSVWLIFIVVVNVFLLSYFIWFFSTNNTEETTTDVEKNILPTKHTADKSQSVSVKQVEKPRQVSIAEQLKKQQTKVKAIVDKPEKSVPEVKKIRPLDVKKNQPVSNSITLKKHDTSPPINHVKSKEKSNELPFLSELDYKFRRTVPDITINVLVYSKIKSERLIMINMTKFVAGDEIIADMELKEIRMDSIVVDYKNNNFQIPR